MGHVHHIETTSPALQWLAQINMYMYMYIVPVALSFH